MSLNKNFSSKEQVKEDIELYVEILKKNLESVAWKILEENAYIAGGCFYSLVRNTQIKDIDIFFY